MFGYGKGDVRTAFHTFEPAPRTILLLERLELRCCLVGKCLCLLAVEVVQKGVARCFGQLVEDACHDDVGIKCCGIAWGIVVLRHLNGTQGTEYVECRIVGISDFEFAVCCRRTVIIV